MAAETMPLLIPGGGAGADIVSGRSPVARPAPGLASSGPRSAGALDDAERSGRSTRDSSSPPRSGTADGGLRQSNSSASQAAQSSGDRSCASGGSRDGSGSASDSAGNGRSAKTGSSGAGTGSGTQSAGSATQGRGTSGAPSAGAAQSAAQGAARAAGANDFAAALAQSLAATPADGAAATDSAANQSQTTGTGESSESHGKHSAAADPVSSALALLEQALAGALVGAQSTPAVASTAGTSTNGASSPAGGISDGAGKSNAAALTALLAQNLPTDTRDGGSNPGTAGGSATSATSATSAASASIAATASTAAALTAAAQLSSGAQIGSQHGTADSSRMALASPVGTSAWTDELGTRLTWMAHQGIESASLQLSPEHLGPLQVTISVHGGQASVWFGAAQPDTRTALQQSLPQLRQLFVSQGLTLADAGVSREPPRGQGRQSSARSTAAVSGVAAVTVESPGTRTTITGGLGLLDTYV